MSKVILTTNFKGGSGKTTTTVNIAACLAKKRYKTLVLDCDAQGSATIYLGVEPSSKTTRDETYSIADCFYRDEPLENCIINVSKNLDLAIGSSELALLDMHLAHQKDWFLVLSELIKPVRDYYDFILLDGPPSLNALNINLLCASTHLVIVTPPLSLDINSCYLLLQEINDVTQYAPVGSLTGIAFTRTRRLKTMTAHMKYLREEFKDLVFKTPIKESVVLAESAANNLDIFRYKPRCASSKQYKNLTNEFLLRV